MFSQVIIVQVCMISSCSQEFWFMIISSGLYISFSLVGVCVVYFPQLETTFMMHHTAVSCLIDGIVESNQLNFIHNMNINRYTLLFHKLRNNL